MPLAAAATRRKRPKPKPQGQDQQAFYVSPTGSDTNPGTLEQPFATMGGARDAVRAFKQANPSGDITVYFRGGTYPLTETVIFGLADSGSDQQTITYTAYPGESPVFSSGQAITGWQLPDDPPAGLPAAADGHVWVADVPTGQLFKTLYDNGQLLTRAQGEGFIPTTKYTAGDQNPTELTQLHYPTGAMPDGVTQGIDAVTDLELVIVPTVNWLTSILPLASVDTANQVATTAIPGADGLGSISTPGPSCWLENAIEFLNGPGQWVVNSVAGKVYYWPESGQPGDVQAPSLTELVCVQGDVDVDGPTDTPVTNLVFQGLSFTQGERDTWPVDYRGHEMLQWDLFDRANALLRFRGAADCVVEDCVFSESGNSAIRCDLYCQQITITGNLIHDVGSSGIILAGYGMGTKDVNKSNTVTNNEIYNTGRLTWGSFGIWMWQSGSNLVANNRIASTSYCGMNMTGLTSLSTTVLFRGSATVRWDEIDAVTGGGPLAGYDDYEPFLHTRDNTVEHNDVSDVMTSVLWDGNGIRISGAARGNVIQQNYIHDIDSLHLQAGYRTDDAQYGTTFTENIVYRAASGSGLVLKQQNDMTNNVVADLDDPVAYLVMILGPVTGSKLQRNVYYSTKAGQQILQEGPSYTGPDPHLTETASDFNDYFCTADPLWGPSFVRSYQLQGYEQNSLGVDPMFYDPNIGDFRMRPGSLPLATGFTQIDPRPIGLTADYRRGNPDEALARLYASVGDQFAAIRLDEGDSASLQLAGRTTSGYTADLSSATITYTSSDTTVATVNSAGRVTAQADGTAEITVTATHAGGQASAGIVVIVGTDTTNLAALASYGDSLLAAATAGTSFGEDPQAQIDNLTAAVNAAHAQLANPGPQSAVDAAAGTLLDAITAYHASTVAGSLVNDTDTRITYIGAWSTPPDSSAFDGDTHVSTAAGAQAVVPFLGTRVALVGPTAPDSGSASVRIDGGTPTTITPTSTNPQPEQLIYRTGDLTPGLHTLTLQATGSAPIRLDGAVLDSPDLTGSTITLTTTPIVAVAGQPSTATVTLTNTSSTATASGTLEIAGPDDWQPTISPSTYQLAPGAQQTATVTVTIPSGTVAPTGALAVAALDTNNQPTAFGLVATRFLGNWNTVFTDTFEDDTPGQPPVGWTVTASDGSGTVQNLSDRTGQGLELVHTDSGSVRVDRAFSPVTPRCRLVLAARAEQTTTNLGIVLLDSASTLAMALSIAKGGNVKYTNGTTYVSGPAYQAGSWHQLEVIADQQAGTYDFYVDDVKIATANLNAAAGPITSLRLQATVAGAATFYVDDVSVMTPGQD